MTRTTYADPPESPGRALAIAFDRLLPADVAAGPDPDEWADAFLAAGLVDTEIVVGADRLAEAAVRLLAAVGGRGC